MYINDIIISSVNIVEGLIFIKLLLFSREFDDKIISEEDVSSWKLFSSERQADAKIFFWKLRGISHTYATC